MNKNKFILIIVLIIVIIICLVTLIFLNKVLKNNNNLSESCTFELIFESQNNEEIINILSKGEINGIDYNVYTYGGNVKIKINDKILTVREAFLSNVISPIDILNKIEKEKNIGGAEKETYKDGGTIVYKYDNYCIIKFNTLEGNKDLYFSKLDFSYDELNNKES